MRIYCPHCGWRPSEEFVPRGLAEAPRPPIGGDDAPEGKAWQDYLHLRDNPRGDVDEYWQHVSGCRSWVVVHRNTLTHEVHGSTMANEFWAKKREQG